MDMDGAELDAEDAWHTVRRHGVRSLLHQSFQRFRFGDGFTNSRALALQMALSVVPFLLALTGLAAGIDDGRLADVTAGTVTALTPGSGNADVLGRAIDAHDGETVSGEDAGEVALAFGLAFAILSMVTAMAQIERGANRIYGIRRDRPALHKYGRAAVLTLVLAVPVGLGFLLLVAGVVRSGGPLVRHTAWSTSQETWWDVLRWPVGLALTTFTISVLLDHAPRRRQPALSWLALGASLSVLITDARVRPAGGVCALQRVVRQRLRTPGRRDGAAFVVLPVCDRTVCGNSRSRLSSRRSAPGCSRPMRSRTPDPPPTESLDGREDVATSAATTRGLPMIFGRKTELPTPENALPGRDTRPFAVGDKHLVLGTPIESDVPDGLRGGRRRTRLLLGRGADLLAARRASGRPRSGMPAASRPTRRTKRSAPGRTGHAEVVRIVFDPQGAVVRAAAQGLLGGARPDPGHAAGQRHRHRSTARSCSPPHRSSRPRPRSRATPTRCR